MAPLLASSDRATLGKLARRALVTAGPATVHHLGRRGLSVNHTQGVTLGVIAAYVVVIALLWNLPYVRWVLWPFKVSFPLYVLDVYISFLVYLIPILASKMMLTENTDVGDCISRVWARYHGLLHGWSCGVYFAGSP